MNQVFEWSECSWYNTNCSFVTLTDGLPLKSHCRGVSVEVPTSLLLLRAVFINIFTFVLLKQMCMVLTLAVLKVYFFHAFLFVLLFCFHFVVLCFLNLHVLYVFSVSSFFPLFPPVISFFPFLFIFFIQSLIFSF